MLDQDAKMMSKTQDEKKVYAHIKCFKCEGMGHFASRCPTKLEKKIQAKLKRQGNEKQHMSKEEKAQSKRKCYSYRETGHMANSCPLGNIPKPISINNDSMHRKDGNGTSMVAIAKYPAVDIEFSSPCRGHTQQAGRVRSMEQIRLASAQAWSILRNPPETCQSI